MSKIIISVPKYNKIGVIFALITLFIINVLIILIHDVLLLIGIMTFDIYGIVYYYLNYLRICKFTKDKLIIYGNLTFDEETKIQKRYEITYNRLKSVEQIKVRKGINSDGLPYKKRKLAFDERYNLEHLDCLLFKLYDGSEKRLFISRLSDNKIELIKSKIINHISK
jgi:hypothetical protein